MKSLALASRVKLLALASKPASSRKCPVLGSRTALFFDLLKMGQCHDQFCFVSKYARELVKKKFEDIFSWRTLEFSGNFTNIWGEDLFFLRNFGAKIFFLFFGDHFRVVSLVLGLGLGLEHSCPWPREGLSSKGLSLALASDFFCILGVGLEPCVLDFTSAASVGNFSEVQ